MAATQYFRDSHKIRKRECWMKQNIHIPKKQTKENKTQDALTCVWKKPRQYQMQTCTVLVVLWWLLVVFQRPDLPPTGNLFIFNPALALIPAAFKGNRINMTMWVIFINPTPPILILASSGHGEGRRAKGGWIEMVFFFYHGKPW